VVTGDPLITVHFEEKRSFGRTRRRSEDDIKMDIKVTGSEGVDWTLVVKNSVQWRDLLNTEMKLRIP
jgi:hypothetical protein